MSIHIERKYKVNKWIIKARWLYIAGILLIGLLTKLSTHTNIDFSRIAMISIAGSVVGFNSLFYIILRNTDIKTKKGGNIIDIVGVGQIIMEASMLLIVMHYSGGIDSIAWVYFFLPIVSASLLFGGVGAVVTAIVSGLLTNTLVVLEYYGIITHINRYGMPSLEFSELSVGLMKSASITFFYIIISLFVGFGAKLLYSREEELSKQSQETSRINKKLDEKISELKKSERGTLKAFMDLKRQKQLTHEEQDKTTSILSNFIDPVIIIDKDNKLNFVNPAAKDIFGFRKSDIGNSISSRDNYSMNNFKLILDREFKVVKGKYKQLESAKYEEVAIEIGGEQNSYRVITVPVKESDGDYLGMMKIFYNITREKILDKLKSDFISIAAHQLRTPLSAIKWAIKMVLDGDAGKLNHEQKLILNKGYMSNERVINLINDMLDVSRIEEGKFDYNFEHVDFQDILVEALVNYDRRISYKNLRVEIKRQEKALPIYVDKEKIIMVIKNLISNAVEYTPEGGKIVIVYEVSKDFFTFSIRDNGVGISEDDQEKIFSKFYRGANVIRMQTDGSGLGLFIVKNIVSKHNGNISFVSQEGQGTEFIITLPIKNPE